MTVHDVGARVALLIRNSGGRLVTEVGGLAARMLLVLILGRVAGARELGLLALASTISSLTILPAVLGVDTWVAVTGARDPSRANQPLVDGMRVVAVLAPAAGLLLAVAGVVAGGDLLTILAGAGALLVPTALMLVVRGGLAGADRLRLAGWGGALDAVVALAVGLPLIVNGAGALGALAGLVAGEVANLVCTGLRYRRAVGPLMGAPSRSRREVVRHARVMAPFRPLAVAFQRADTLLVAGILGERAVGLYGAATNVTLSAPMLAAAVGDAMLPRLSRPDPRQVRSTSGALIRLLSFASLPLAAGLVIFAPQVLRLLYGGGFAASEDALRILAVAIPLTFANRTLATTTLGLRRAPWVTIAIGTGLAVNVGANLLLLPTMGVVGAAWATLVSEVGQTVVLGSGLRRIGAMPNAARELAPAGIAAAGFLAAGMALGASPATLAIGVGLAALMFSTTIKRGLLARVVADPVPTAAPAPAAAPAEVAS
jgi:O-antigen/teichoic acid export membrane protein